MGAATASTMFFRSIGSTMGVAVFGSLLLTIYKHDFAAGVPAGIPQSDLKPFLNPLMLAQLRPQLERAFGMNIWNTLFADVRSALTHGLQVLFLVSAIVMTAAVVLNTLLPEVPLRGRVAKPDSPAVESSDPVAAPLETE
jgi:hypothetical protein